MQTGTLKTNRAFYKVLVLSILFALLVQAGCSNTAAVVINESTAEYTMTSSSINPAETEQSTANDTVIAPETQIKSPEKEFKLVDELKEDLDNDGSADDIRVLSRFDGVSGAYLVKISVNAAESVYEFEDLRLNAIKKTQIVKLDNVKKGILLTVYEGEVEDGAVYISTPYLYKRSCLILGFEKGSIVTLLDAYRQPFNMQENYKVENLGGFKIGFSDKATGFSVKYKLILDEVMAEVYEERMPNFEDFRVAEGISQNYFDIKIEDTDSDGMNEVICSKGIPGLYHNHMLGDIDYIFKLADGRFVLAKERLAYGFIAFPGKFAGEKRIK